MDKHTITSEAALREHIGAEVPGIGDKNIDTLDSYAQEFIAKSPFIILATSDAQGNLDASPKGDGAGFVHVQDERTLLIPDRPGNKLAYGHLNILNTAKVGIIFVLPGTNETLRVNGDAELTSDPVLCEQLGARGKPATLVTRVHVREQFFHCAKAFIRSELWQSASWQPRHKVSFGEIFAARREGELNKDLVGQIDAAVHHDYEENL